MNLKKEEERLSDILVLFSALGVIFAGMDAYGTTVMNLAATQWLLVSAVMMLWAIFIHLKD